MNQFQSMGEIIGVLKRRWWIMLLMVLLGCAASVYYAMNQPRLYETTAVIQIESARITEPGSATGSAAADDSAHRLRLIEQRLMARDQLIKVIEKHGLFADVPDLSMGQKVVMLRGAASIMQITNGAPSWQPQGTPSGLFITVRMGDAQKAADIANELVAGVVEQSRERSFARARDTLNFFVIEEDRVGQEIEAAESRIAAFRQENAQSLGFALSTQRSQLTRLRENELEIDGQLLSLQSNSSRLREDELTRQTALLREQKALIVARIDQMEAAIDAAPAVDQEFNVLERELTQLQDQYSVITRRKAEAEMGQMLQDRQQSERFEVLESALVPEFPISRSRKKTAMMGAVASVIAALGAAVLLEVLNPAIRSAAQLERQLDLRAVVTIPKVKTRRERRKIHVAWFAGLITLILAVPFFWRGVQDQLVGMGLLAGNIDR